MGEMATVLVIAVIAVIAVGLVLATFSVDVDPPRVGAAYIDPRAVLHTALERRVTNGVRARPAARLTDVVIDEVDLLLHPGRPDDDG